MQPIELFVPGRLCLFGEHSDWAGEYRAADPSLPCGYCIAVGTDQGIRARASRCDGRFRASTVLPDGTSVEPLDAQMEASELRRIAREGGFWSYAAGTAHEVLQEFGVGGISLECYGMDLPLQKGLSSSAAICVLTARAWNRLHSLGMDTRAEMEIAYRGEVLTPSRCGRMDQVCAFGQVPMFLTFDGHDMAAQPIALGAALHYLIVDLGGAKDTVRILRDLNSHFPDAPGAVSEGVRRGLGSLNEKTLLAAREALEAGDRAAVGSLMTEAQQAFDRYVAPGCPSELSAPLLHDLLAYPSLSDLVHGGKGVGSQGDGTAQFLARGPEERERARSIIENDLGMTCLDLTLRPGTSDRAGSA
jgi:galactokinase